MNRVHYPQIGYFRASDGYRFAVRVWEAKSPPAEVVFLHGIVSHGGWYLKSCSFLADQGFRVHFLDRRGSGLNLESRGDVPSMARWIDDVAEYLSQLPHRPRIVLGISWGAKLAVAVAKTHPHLVDAIGLIGPGIFAFQQAGTIRQLLLRVLRALGFSRLRVTIPLQDPHLFTENPEWLDYLAGDPLTLRKVTARFAVEDLKLNRLARAEPQRISFPALLMLAGRDRICDNQRTRQLFDRFGGPKELIEYPQAHHTLEFEPDPTPYFADLARWIKSVASR